MKGMHVRAKDKYVLRTPRTLQEYFTRIGLAKAVSQVKETVQACRSGEVAGLPDPWSHDNTAIQPVIVTYERVPELSLMRQSILKLMGGGPLEHSVRPVILMSSEDMDNIVSLPPSDDLWRVLTEYVISGATQSFFNFLGPRRRSQVALLYERRNRVIDAVSVRLGL